MHEISGARRDRKTLTHFHSIDPPFGSSWTHVQEGERKNGRECVCMGGAEEGETTRELCQTSH